MSDDGMTAVPTVLIEKLRDDTTTLDRISIRAIAAIIACLPKPPPWRIAHDALAAHGRARIAKRPEDELQSLWHDYCLALDKAIDQTCT